MAKLVDAVDLKSAGLAPCGFESRSRHHPKRGTDFGQGSETGAPAVLAIRQRRARQYHPREQPRAGAAIVRLATTPLGA